MSPVTESFTTVFQRIHWKTDFTNIAISSSTKVSKFYGIIKAFLVNEKKRHRKTILHWSVIDHPKPCTKELKMCNLCLTEKYHIFASPVYFINKRSELVSKYRHENKFYSNPTGQLVKIKAAISNYSNMKL